MDTNFDDDTIQQIVRTAIQHPQFILLKSQQRGEEEPSFEEKQRVLESLLRRDKALFLEKYGKFLDEAALQKFTRFKDDYEIHWHLNQLLPKFQNKENYQKTTEHQKRNRRFRYMQQHLLNTDFFSPENMRLRSPALYHMLVGKYQEVEEFEENLPLSEKLLKNMDYSESERRRLEEEAQYKDSDSESELNTDDHSTETKPTQTQNEQEQNNKVNEDQINTKSPFENQSDKKQPEDHMEINRENNNRTNSNENNNGKERTVHFGELHEDKDKIQAKLQVLELLTKFITKQKQDNTNKSENKGSEESKNKKQKKHIEISEEEKQERINTLTELMKQKFINGEDSEFFDYSQVDDNPDYDDIEQWQRDSEDSYFDSEPPSQPENN